jgi:integrase
MQRVKNQQYLYRQSSGIYWFRRAVPQDARSAFDGRREVQVSLRTSEIGVARHRLGDHLKAFDVRLSRARGRGLAVIDGGPDADALAPAVRQWLKQRLEADAPSLGKRREFDRGPEGREADLLQFEGAVSRALKSGSPPPQLTLWTADAICQKQGWQLDQESPLWLELCNLVARAEIEFARQAQDQLNGRDGAVYNKALFGPERYADDDRNREAPTVTLKSAVDAFLADPSLKADKRTRKKYQANFDMLLEWFGEKRAIASITRAECRSFRDEVICKLPSHKHQKLGQTSLRDALSIADLKGMARISPKTQNQIIDNMRAVFEWAVNEEVRPDNPARSLRIAVDDDEQVRDPFDPAQLERIFTAPLYVGCRDDRQGYAKPGSAQPRGHRFWIPLLGLFTGMRLNEICQLQMKNVQQRDGIWTFNLRKDAEAGVNLKNKASARTVPLHPALAEIGFADYLKERDHEEWLFDLDRKGRHNGSDPVSKWFARFLNSVDIKDPRLVFHSFRHTFRDALREAGVDPEVSFALGGWKDSRIGNRYGKGHSVRSLFEAISRVTYVGLDLSHLKPSNAVQTSIPLGEPEILQPVATAAE